MLMISRVVLAWISFIMLSIFPPLLSAAEVNTKLLSIAVEGNHSVEKEMILEKLSVHEGERLDRRKLSRDVRELYKTGFFSDIRFIGDRTAKGIHLVCHVHEYPVIASITLEGNEKFKSKDLKKRLKLKVGRMYSEKNRRADRHMLLRGYLKKGYYQAAVNMEAKPRKDGRVDVVIHVREGSVTHINRINFVGNRVFSDSELANVIASRHSDLSSWFSDRDVFDRKRFSADMQMLQQYYLNHGYIDMRVESTQLAMAADKKSFSLTFSLHEGAQYTVSDVLLQGDIVPDKKTLKPLIKMEKGEIYALADLQKSLTALTERVGDEGYAFASVTPLLHRDIEAHTVAIAFDIEKGQKVYVERVEVRGNVKSDDMIVRRLVWQPEGALYSGSSIKRSKSALRRAPFAKDVRISLPKGSAPDKVNVDVNLTEKKTGSISGGIGYSQREKMILTAKISESNLFGEGYQASINGNLGAISQNMNASISDPYFMGKNISATLSVNKVKTDPLIVTQYQTDNFGGNLSFGFPLADHLTYSLGYAYSRTTLRSTAITTSLLYLAQVGLHSTSEVNQTISWDDRDTIIATKNGELHQLRLAIAGQGGSERYLETTWTEKAYFPFGKEESVVLSPSLSASWLQGYGGKKPSLWKRYSLGGIGSLRGFDTFGVSVRDQATGDAVGGDKMVTASMNLFFPLPYMHTSGFRLVAFMDAGTVWGSVSTVVAGRTAKASAPFSLSTIRASTGLGVEWISPVGPIGLSWAVPLRKQPGDLLRSFEFSVGSTF